MSDIVHVAVAVILNDVDEVCISLRHDDSHQGGLWEFPGGKIEKDETVEHALRREIKEELGIDITDSRPLITIRHDYSDKKVCLHVRKVLSYQGQAVGVEGQKLEWVPVTRLSCYIFPAANQPIIQAVQLPDRYLITGKFADEDDFLTKLKNALDDGIKMVQLRLKDKQFDMSRIQSLLQQVSALCVQAEAKLLLNIPEDYQETIDMQGLGIDGVHADSKTLNKISQRPDCKLFSASCHNEDELLKAIELHADFVVLSPVQKTASHPEMEAMGWQQFSRLVESCAMPVYALGGVSIEDMKDAWRHGAQGIAAISAFWR